MTTSTFQLRDAGSGGNGVPVTIMRADDTAADTTLILLVGESRGVVRSLKPTLLRQGYVVTTADDGALLRERSAGAAPDAILLDGGPPEENGLALCSRIRAEHTVGPAPAVMILMPTPPSRAQRIEALRAGASDCLGPDEEELLLRLAALVRPRVDAERMRADAQFDATTGLYSLHGLIQRAHEVAALMVRQHGPLACLVLALEPPVGDELALTIRTRVAQSVCNAGRRSDVRGQLGKTEFVILAPGTDALGARGLAQRLAFTARDTAERAGLPARIRVGYDAIPNLGYEPIDPVVLLQRARAAVHDQRSGATPDAGDIRRFEATRPPDHAAPSK